MKKIAYILFGRTKNYNHIQHAQFNKHILPSLEHFQVDYYRVTTKQSDYTDSPDLANCFDFHSTIFSDTHGEQYISLINIIKNSLLFTLIPLHNNNNCKRYYELIGE